MTDRRDDDDAVTAAELAFGLLDDPERRAAEARAATDTAFAAEVALWQERAMSLFDRDAQPPHPELWRSIVARLPANDDQAVRRWRWATGAAVAAALVLGVLALRPTAPGPAPAGPVVAIDHPLVAMLRAADGPATLAVSIDPGRRGLVTTPAAMDLGKRAAELWVIPVGQAPRSLGVVPGQPQWRPVTPALAAALTAGATLAVSSEPAGGSPTGQPTGPVLMSATISAT